MVPTLVFASVANVRIGKKDFKVTNTLAYDSIEAVVLINFL